MLQGTWTIQVEVQKPSSSFEDISGTWIYYFGEGCEVGEPCQVTADDRGGDGRDTSLTPAAGGFRFTEDIALDCFDTVTNEVSTPHGADYHLVATLVPAATQDRDGTTYVTSMRGTVVETIDINAAGLANECTVDGTATLGHPAVRARGHRGPAAPSLRQGGPRASRWASRRTPPRRVAPCPSSSSRAATRRRRAPKPWRTAGARRCPAP